VPEYAASVFASHAYEDKPLNREICARLEEHGCRMWIDEDDLRVGDNLADGIFGAIDQADFVLALISANSVDSGWCRKEWSVAVNLEIQRGVVVVLPVRLDDTPVPLLFRDKVHLDIRSMDPRQAAEEIMKSIREHVAPTRALPARRARSVHASPTKPGRVVRPPRKRLRAALSYEPASPGHFYLPYD
jgi:hypothetical protein